ncbi:hypothetical protein ABPG74_021937 [Tetrahymena malaccensis]
MNYLKTIIIIQLIICIFAFEQNFQPQLSDTTQNIEKKIKHSFNYHQDHIKYNPFRITADFSRLEKYIEENQIKLIQQAFNKSTEYFSQVILIEQSQDRIRFPTSQKCGKIDIDFRDIDEGIENSDLHIYFDLDHQTLAQACAFSHINGRPIFGYFMIQKSDLYQDIQLKFIRQMKQLIILSEKLYPNFIDKSKKQYQKDVYSNKILTQNKTITLLKFPNLKNAAQKYFQCDLIEGMVMISDKNEQIHDWIYISDEQNIQKDQENLHLFNVFDISLLKDSGWYHVKSIQQEKLEAQNGAGCKLLNKYQVDKIYQNIMQISNLKCHSNCQTCFGESELECLSCKNNSRLLNYECINICSDSQIWDYEASQCKQFMPELKTMYCNYCISGQFCHQGQCLDSCEEGFSTKVVESNVVCEKCQQNCLSCISPELCLKCQNHFKLQNGKCVSECESGYYLNNSSYCQKCHHSCSSCIGNGFNQCISCPDSSILKDGECHQVEKNSNLYNFKQNITNTNEESIEKNDLQNNNLEFSNSKRSGRSPSRPRTSSRSPSSTMRRSHIGHGGRGQTHHIDNKLCGQGYFAQTVSGKHICLKCMIGCVFCKQLARCDKCGLGYQEQNGVCEKKSEKK